MEIDRTAKVIWTGAVRDGKGLISTQSGSLADYPYGFSSRFEGQKGSNPEELLGAAHAACFTMALSLLLGEAKLVPERLETNAKVTLSADAGNFRISLIRLSVQGTVPGADSATFVRIAEAAKEMCALSIALKAVPLDFRAELI